MQSHFRQFLNTPRGKFFLTGGSKPGDPGLNYVLVDEYQDTNPIQAEIYFALASMNPHNLAVVGEDDQVICRFRVGTVEGIVNFEVMCNSKWGILAMRANLLH